MAMPIVDSHIHLFPKSHLKTLAWYSPSSPLNSQHSIDEYKAACASCIGPNALKPGPLRGFVFIETDRISGIEPTQWDHVLDEVAFVSRIAQGRPLPGEGHSPADKALCLGIVPWAPLPAGPDVLKSYLEKVRQQVSKDTQADVWNLVCSVRYLVQDKPPGVMLKPKFIESLKWLSEQGLTFDLGVDQRRGGLWQLEEAVQMLEQVNRVDGGQKPVRVIINHMCKPDFLLSKNASQTEVLDCSDYKDWKACITRMAAFPNTYMKLSGGFSELPPQPTGFDNEEDEKALAADIAGSIQPWASHIFKSFSPSRVMFGSDWPVCNINGGGNDVSWKRWTAVVEHILETSGLSVDEKAAVWGQNSLIAYNLTISC